LTAFNDKKTRKAKKIHVMNDLLATLELSLDKMIKSGESEREQASLKTMIDKKRLKI
jgi:hypothetical protein